MNRSRLGRPAATDPAANRTAQLAVTLDESPQLIVQTNLSAQDMDDALDAGYAVHLSPLITDFIHHQKHWWIA